MSELRGRIGAAVAVTALFVGSAALGDEVAAPQAGAAADDATADAADADGILTLVDGFIASREINRSHPRWKEQLPPPPLLKFESDRRYSWELDTSEGPLVIRLLPDVARAHVSSTIYLTRLGFYDSLKFHRVIPGFMAQGGDPKGNGTGNPGYLYAGEFVDSVRHDRRGVVSMANRGPETDGSQFFIMFGPATHLDGKHTIFGEVVGGRRTLAAIEARGSKSGRPRGTIQIKRATIRVD
jgi:cyclophilin family peptidyl-prolyl cis-trans isomerase